MNQSENVHATARECEGTRRVWGVPLHRLFICDLSALFLSFFLVHPAPSFLPRYADSTKMPIALIIVPLVLASGVIGLIGFAAQVWMPEFLKKILPM